MIVPRLISPSGPTDALENHLLAGGAPVAITITGEFLNPFEKIERDFIVAITSIQLLP